MTAEGSQRALHKSLGDRPSFDLQKERKTRSALDFSETTNAHTTYCIGHCVVRGKRTHTAENNAATASDGLFPGLGGGVYACGPGPRKSGECIFKT